MIECLQLNPALPELLLAGGAMVLLLIGAYEGERVSRPTMYYAKASRRLSGMAAMMMPASASRAIA